VGGLERRCIALVELLSIGWIDQEFCFIESGVFMSLRKIKGLGRATEYYRCINIRLVFVNRVA
jgi:hypothetical protein